MNDQNALLAALEFQRAAGVTATVGAVAIDRFADSQVAKPAAHPHAQAKPLRPVPEKPAAPLTQFEPGAPLLGGEMAGLPHAQAAAQAAQSIPDLVKAIEEFEHCELKKTARSTIVLDGNMAAQVLLIGEAPGAQEDAEGLPFVGAAGALLNNMLAAIGLKRDTHVLISNSVFWRPLGNRTPNDGELAVCRPFVARLIELNQPKIIVTLGAAATKSLLGLTGITRARGKWTRYQPDTPDQGAEIPALPMLHPAYLLRMPTTKREAWMDLRALKTKMEEIL